MRLLVALAILTGSAYALVACWGRPHHKAALQFTNGVFLCVLMAFCSAQAWTPRRLKSVRAFVVYCHPWVGLLSAWVLVLHARFFWPRSVMAGVLCAVYLSVFLPGVIVWHMKDLLPLTVRNPKDSVKKRWAILVLNGWFFGMRAFHEALHLAFYVLAAAHAYFACKFYYPG